MNLSLRECLSVGTYSSCGASLFQLLLHASNVCITQLLQAVVFLQIVPLLYSCTLSVLVFSVNLSSWLVLVACFLKPMRLIFVGGRKLSSWSLLFGLLSDPTSRWQNTWIIYCTNSLSTWPYGADVHINNTSQLSKCGCLT